VTNEELKLVGDLRDGEVYIVPNIPDVEASFNGDTFVIDVSIADHGYTRHVLTECSSGNTMLSRMREHAPIAEWHPI